MQQKQMEILNFYPETQSFLDEKKAQKIVFSGYLLNSSVLKAELCSKEFVFATDTDAEVALYAYQYFGKEFLLKLKGAFSLVIQDLDNGSLLLARDRVGSKPLYYANLENKFIFAPDLKRILTEKPIQLNINKIALAQYFMLTYIPAPLTILNNVYKVMPGWFLTVSQNGEMAFKQYWDLEYSKQDKIEDYNECKQLLRKQVFSAVEDCMNGKTDIGAFLSGGFDSTIITGIMSQISDRPIDTFTIGFNNNKQYDESELAALVSRYHKTNHHVLFLDSDSILQIVDKVIDNMDEPFADSSSLPSFAVCNFAKQYTSTILTGDSGDEQFAGYNKYLIGYYSNQYNKIPKCIRNGVIKPLVHILPANISLARKAKKVIQNANQSVFEQRRNVMCLGARPDMINRLLTFDGTQCLSFIQDVYCKYDGIATEVDRTLYTDFKIVLEGDMMPKMDRASGLAEIETRVPLLHPDVVDLVRKIPDQFKIQKKDRKIIFKNTFSDLIPDKLFTAPKHGFSAPVADLFANDLNVELKQTLDPSFIEKQGLLQPEYVSFLIKEHTEGKANYDSLLWAIYVFEKWYMKYFN